MRYNETIIIRSNKAKRILEIRKHEGIELYNSIDDKSQSATGVSLKNFQKQTEKDLTMFSEWTEITKNRMKEIFLTPRLIIEFNKKNKLENEFPTNPYGLQMLMKQALLQQIYFLEVIINEVHNYRTTEKMKSNKMETQAFGLTNFNMDSSK